MEGRSEGRASPEPRQGVGPGPTVGGKEPAAAQMPPEASRGIGGVQPTRRGAATEKEFTPGG